MRCVAATGWPVVLWVMRTPVLGLNSYGIDGRALLLPERTRNADDWRLLPARPIHVDGDQRRLTVEVAAEA